MTTATASTYASLVAGVQKARNQRLILWSLPTAPSINGSYLVWTGKVTASEGMESYDTWVREDFQEQPVRISAHCTCKAGEFGTACKHLAMTLSEVGLLDEANEYRILNPQEYLWLTEGRLD